MASTRPARKVAAIQRKLPDKIELPVEFAAFVKLVTHPKDRLRDLMNVTWSDPRPLLNADKSAVETFVPFVLFADGGVAALWLDGSDLRVATCDSEGQFEVLAEDFGDFVARLGDSDASLLDQMELDAPLDAGAVVPGRKARRVPQSTQKAFDRWVARHSLDAKPIKTESSDVLRSALHAIARRMLEDGLSRVYTPDSPFWTGDFQLRQAGGRWNVTYLDYGEWRPVPTKYGFEALLPALLAVMKTRKKGYELSVWMDGTVFADRGNQLVLEP
jgi:hypothetical protein